jgi:quinol monooxygenase YgiN
MFLTLVRIYPSLNELEAVRAFLMGLVEPTRVQPGCLACTIATESEPDALVYMESWESTDDLLRRLRSDDYSKILAMMELSTRKPDVWVYEVRDPQGLEFIEKIRMGSEEPGSAPL